MEQKSGKGAGTLIGIAIVLIVAVVTIFSGKNSSAPAASSNPTAPTFPVAPTATDNGSSSVTAPADIPKKNASVYKDGTYSATGSYMSPGGEDQINVTLVIANDIVTGATVTPAAGDRVSSRYQQMFISGYQSQVIGKNIADINVTRVSGSSLTPEGFNDALAQIKTQAQA